MKEYVFPLKDVFAKGLRSSGPNRRNVEGLVESLNGVPTQDGLGRRTNRASAFPSLTFQWPFPQVFFLKNFVLVGQQDGLYELQADGTFLQVILMNTDMPWEVIDFADYVIALNKTEVYERDIDTGVYTSVPIDRIPNLISTCSFKGQLVGIARVYDDVETYVHRVYWGNIGEANFTIDRRNIAGYAELEDNGEGRTVKALYEGFVAYTTEAITLFTPISEPAPTFAKRKILDKGIVYPGCVGVGRDEHIVLTSDGELVRVSTNGIESLGYREFLSDVNTSEVRITYNPIDDEYYICNGYVTYVLTKQGLGTIGELVTSGGLYDGRFEGIFKGRSNNLEIVTSEFDMGVRGMKTVSAIELTASTEGELEVAIDWRSSYSQGFRRSKFIRLNPNATIALPVSGVEFRIVVRQRDEFKSYIDTAVVRWKLTDKRNIRGPYVA